MSSTRTHWLRRTWRVFRVVAIFLGICGLGAAWAQPPAAARIYLTARDTSDRLALKGTSPFEIVGQPDEHSATVIVDPTRVFQTIQGIGGALTDAAAETFFRLPPARQKEVLTAYYDGDKGIGYTLARTHINSCDFSSESYAYDAVTGDLALKHFSVAHDEKFRIPFIHRVLAMVPALKIFASPWSPPAWMKSNADMLHGGKLKPRCYSAWAHYYVRFIDAYARRGIRIWGLTVQNEPMAAQTWESCTYTAEEERDFVKHHLGPILHAAHHNGVKLMIWDHNRGLLYQRASTVLSDADAARYVWGTAYHWYVGDEFRNVGMVHDAFPNKAVFFSEGCNYPFSWTTIDDWKWGEEYGRSMISDFNQWACGWTDWNVLLDERGGPNHVQNFCFAPIIGDTRTGQLHYMNSYYYIGHFSKFVRPGARRIACTSTTDDLLATAFQNADGRIVTVIMNPTDKTHNAQVWMARKAAKVAMPAHSIATVVFWRKVVGPRTAPGAENRSVPRYVLRARGRPGRCP